MNYQLLRKANITRLPRFKKASGQINHKKPDGSDWAPEQWLQALVGEMGEYANFRKKYDRGDLTPEEFKIEAGKELADFQLYLDLLAMRCLDRDDSAHPIGVSLYNGINHVNPRFSELHGKNPAKCLQALTARVGAFAELREQLDLHEIGFDEYAYKAGYAIATIQAYLMLVAKSCLNKGDYIDTNGIDLWQCSVDKFNEVSHRVAVDVFIENNNVEIKQP